MFGISKKFVIGIMAIVALIITVGCSATPDGSTAVPTATPPGFLPTATQSIDQKIDAANEQYRQQKGDECVAAVAQGKSNDQSCLWLTATPFVGEHCDATNDNGWPLSNEEFRQDSGTWVCTYVDPTTPQPTAAAPDQPTPAAPIVANVTNLMMDGMSEFIPTKDETHGMWDDDGYLPQQLNVQRCWRSWQAVQPDASGSKNAPWVVLLCNMQYSGNIDIVLVEPTHWVITGNGELRFLMVRDLLANQQMADKNYAPADPYDVFLAGDVSYPDEYGLSAYASGDGTILDQFGRWVELALCDFIQMPLPRDMMGGWLFDIKVDEGERVDIWLGSFEPVQCDGNCGQLSAHSAFFLPYMQPSH